MVEQSLENKKQLNMLLDYVVEFEQKKLDKGKAKKEKFKIAVRESTT